MSQNLNINGVVYNGVDSLEMTNTAGEKITYEEVIPVVPGDPVAQIGDVTYDSVAKALDTANAGETVTVIANSVETDIYIPEGVKLDLNGKNVTVSTAISAGDVYDTTGGAGKLIVAAESAAFSKDNTLLPIYDGAAYRFTTVVKSYNVTESDGTVTYACFFRLAAKGTSERTEFTNLLSNNLETSQIHAYVRVSWTGELGTVSQDYDLTPYISDMQKNGKSMAVRFDNTEDRDLTFNLFVSCEGDAFTVKQNVDEQQYTADTTVVAKIGDVEYTSVSKALDAAVSGDTVVMIADATEAANLVVPVGVTLDLAGHSLTADSLFVSGIIRDNTDGAAMLYVPAEFLSVNEVNPLLPLYDDKNNAFRFISVDCVNALDKNADGSLRFRFKFSFATSASAATSAVVRSLLTDGLSANKLIMNVIVSWTTPSGTTINQIYPYADDTAATVINSNAVATLTYTTGNYSGDVEYSFVSYMESKTNWMNVKIYDDTVRKYTVTGTSE